MVTSEQQHPAVAAALDVVRSAPSLSMRELPDGGLALEVEAPKRRNVWLGPAAGFVAGVVVLLVGNWLRQQDAGPYVSRGPIMLMVMGALCMVFGPMGLLIMLMQGPPRNVSLEARPGLLKADRSVAGDRVVSSFAAADVDCLFIDGALFASTRKGEQQLISFGSREVHLAIATLLASRLWHPAEVVGASVPKLNRWVVMPRPDPDGDER